MRRALVTVALAALLAGCGGTSHTAAPGSSAGVSITPSVTPAIGTSKTPAPRIDARGPALVQLRVVVLAPDGGAPAPGSQPQAPASWVARYKSYRCGHGVLGDPTSYVVECDTTARYKFLLAPPTWTGKVRSASAGVPEGQAAWAVNILLDHEGTAAFTKLSRQLYASGGQVAILVGTDLLSASSFDGIITDGSMQITGSFTEASAKALAHRLTGS